ncbi:MAG TPA: cyclodeaminase/cyclohydrolase family protein [Allosphingosinicella sp.]|nr:cyclodeaminase/cyclohydrolase family protein [Allosphingosinicella sp.]
MTLPPMSRRTVGDLFEQAGSTAPTPGGGSVSALCGMLGIALILKALRISIRKNEDRDSYAALDADLVRLADALAEDAEADERAFQAYIDAAGLPRTSEPEKEARGAALGRAAIVATDAALATLRHAREAFAISRALEPAIKDSIRADLVAGRELLRVVRSVAVENAQTNLRSLKDEAERQRLSHVLDRDGAADAFA